VAAKISTLEKAPDVMAVFAAPDPLPLVSLRSSDLLVLYADRVADPGNLGTLVRAAAGFGATAVVASPDTVDLLSPKVLRAGMGAVFCLPLYQSVTLAALLDQVGAARVYGLVARGGDYLAAAALERPAVVCVGAERAGLSDDVQELLTDRLTIQLQSGPEAMVESLNAGVAGAIALYEFSRRPGGAADHRRGRPRASGEG
jgi:TrmH family RNA methyltransferase